jgi:uncharacterized protein (TIGR02145 family)
MLNRFLLIFLTVFGLTQSLFSQTIPPPYINYQAVLYDVNGANPNAVLANQSFSTYVNIQDELGNLLYKEEHYASTDANGQITVKIGDGVYLQGTITNFNQINWGSGKYYLIVDFDINGTISSTAPEQLVTVPYSFYAGKAGNGMTSVLDNGNGTLTFNYENGASYTTPQLTGLQGTSGSIPPGSAAGNTPYWDGSQWVVNGANFYNNGAGLGVGTIAPDASSLLDVSSTSKGLLVPRMTVTQRNAIVNPANGLIIFNTTSGCPNYYYNGNWREWCGSVVNPLITTLSCGTASLTGALIVGQVANSVSVTVPYTGGNGAQYAAQSVNSTGVLGLTATISIGYLALGSGNLVYTISGTPASSGNASFTLNIGGQSCSVVVPVASVAASLTTLSCVSGTTTGTLTNNTAASGVSKTIPYTGGNGGSYSTQAVSSTGVLGLTANLAGGTIAVGAGNLVYTISGTPSSSGTASFAITIGGQSCTFSIPVQSSAGNYPSGSVFCASGVTAIVDVTNPVTGKTWMDRNLGASQVATSSADINSYGDLYQWGRRSDGHQCRTSVTTTTLSSTDQPSNGNFILINTVNGDWRSTPNNNLWQGTNGINNPCPTGYRLPTQTEFNSEKSTWSSNSIAGAFGSPMKLPAAGGRASMIANNGSILSAGIGGLYWTSTTSSNASVNLSFGTVDAAFSGSNLARADGNSVRCIKEAVATVGSINCGSAVQTGVIYSGQSVVGVSISLPYTGGNGGFQLNQVYNSTGVNGLTATLASGVIANGSGNFVLTISGTAATTGIANFALSIGGQTCTLSVNIETITAIVSSLNCATSTTNGTLNSGVAASGVTTAITYTGGNGGNYASQVFSSTGVSGLTANLAGGILAVGAGNLVYTISGTPTSSGTASFSINIGGQSCAFSIPVQSFAGNYPSGSVFCASGPTAIVEVTNPVTGRTWMDRNLGATQVATSSTDIAAYGDLYQWGRRSDGHQCRTSSTITSLSSTDTPAHGSFILTDNEDWRNPSNNNLWQGLNGINNPCPTGFKVPTQTELNNERNTWSTNNSAGAFSSPLKLTFTGFRIETTGAISNANNAGYYWTSNAVQDDQANFLSINNTSALTSTEDIRASGRSVRCIKN